MTPIVDALSTAYQSLLDGVYDCVDRLAIRAYFSCGHTPGGLRTWWRLLTGSDATLDDTHLMRMASHFARRLYQYAKTHQIPISKHSPGDRKHEEAEAVRPTEPDSQGLFLIQVARAKARIWTVKRTDTTIKGIYQKEAYVNHFFLHFLDPAWGHVTIRICSHPPFDALILLNGHEWVDRQARQAGLDVTKEENCFTAAKSWEDLGRLAATLSAPQAIGQVTEVCARWLTSSVLCFALSHEEQVQSQFTYAYSTYQLEYSRNLIFTRGVDVDRVFQGLIDRTRRVFDLKRLRTILGFRPRSRRKRRDGTTETRRVQCQIERPRHDLTVFKIHVGLITLKIYDKGDHVLRIEVVVHNITALRAGKVLHALPALLETLQGMLVRFLAVVHAAHHTLLDPQALDTLAQPSARGARRVAGVNLNQPRQRAAVRALLALGPHPTGFRVSEFAAQVRAMTGEDSQTYTDRQAAYDLQKLRGKAVIERVGRSHRYRVNLAQYPVVCAAVLLREAVQEPLCSTLAHTVPPQEPTPVHPLDQQYMKLRQDFIALCDTLNMAA